MLLNKKGEEKTPYAAIDLLKQFKGLLRIMRNDPSIADTIPVLKDLAIRSFGLMCASEFMMTAQLIPVMFFFNELNSPHRSAVHFAQIITTLTAMCFLSYSLDLRKAIRRERLNWHQWFMWWSYGHRQELRQSVDWADRYTKGDRESMVEKNINHFEGLIDQLMFISLPAATKITFVFVGLWFVGWTYGVVALVTIAVYATSVWKTEKGMGAQREASRKQLRKLEIFGTEMTNMYVTSKELGIEEMLSDRNHAMLSQFCEDQAARDEIRLTRYARQGGVLSGSKILLYAAIAAMSLRTEPNIGAIVMATAWMEQMYSHLLNFANLQMYVSQGYVALKELVGMMQLVPKIRQPENPVSCKGLSADIVFHNVSYAYPSNPGRLVLTNINLTIRKGEKVAFVGPSGGGKTTIAKLIGRTDDPVSGYVTIGGVDVREIDYYELREFVRGVSQGFDLFSMTVLENISIATPSATFEDVVQAAKLADAHDFIMNLPEGYDTQVGESGGRLSGGQRQRIAIARSLVSSAAISIDDESTSAQDALTQTRVKLGMDTWAAKTGRTSVIIAHRISTIRDADRVVVIGDGRIVEQGPPDWLYRQEGEFWRLCNEEAAAVSA